MPKKIYSARAWWTDANGEKHSKFKTGFKTKSAAEEWKQEVIESNSGNFYPEAHRLTMENLFIDFIKRCEKKKLSPKTTEQYESHIKKINSCIGNVLVQELTTYQIQKMFYKLQEMPIIMSTRKSKLPEDKRRASETKPLEEKKVRFLSSASIRSIYRVLRAALNYARTLGIIKYNPCFGIELPENSEREQIVYSADDLATLLQLLKEQQHCIYFPIVLSTMYALRRGEAIGVRWRDIDFENNLIYIRKNLTSSRSKTLLKKVKSESSEDTISISDWTRDELRALQRQRMEAGCMTMAEDSNKDEIIYLPKLRPSDFVCLDADGKIFRPDGMMTRLHTFQKAHGLPISSWHGLRHTYGTLMVEDGIDIVTVSKAMRHSSIKITSDQYVNSTTKIKQNATAAMDKILGFSKKESAPLEHKSDEK